VRIEIACNNPDNGLFDGVARAIHIGPVELSSNTWDWAPRLTEGDGWIRIGGKKLRCSGSTYGVVNWCWKAYFWERDDVEALLNWPRFRKWFSVDTGTESLYGKWKTGEPLRFKRATIGGAA